MKDRWRPVHQRSSGGRPMTLPLGDADVAQLKGERPLYGAPAVQAVIPALSCWGLGLILGRGRAATPAASLPLPLSPVAWRAVRMKTLRAIHRRGKMIVQVVSLCAVTTFTLILNSKGDAKKRAQSRPVFPSLSEVMSRK